METRDYQRLSMGALGVSMPRDSFPYGQQITKRKTLLQRIKALGVPVVNERTERPFETAQSAFLRA